MRTNKYLKFKTNYPPDNPKWFKEIKYGISQETSDLYFLGEVPIKKSLEFDVYIIEQIKDPNKINR